MGKNKTNAVCSQIISKLIFLQKISRTFFGKRTSTLQTHPTPTHNSTLIPTPKPLTHHTPLHPHTPSTLTKLKIYDRRVWHSHTPPQPTPPPTHTPPPPTHTPTHTHHSIPPQPSTLLSQIKKVVSRDVLEPWRTWSHAHILGIQFFFLKKAFFVLPWDWIPKVTSKWVCGCFNPHIETLLSPCSLFSVFLSYIFESRGRYRRNKKLETSFCRFFTIFSPENAWWEQQKTFANEKERA